MKKLFAILLILAICLSVSACGQDKPRETTPETTTSPKMETVTISVLAQTVTESSNGTVQVTYSYDADGRNTGWVQTENSETTYSAAVQYNDRGQIAVLTEMLGDITRVVKYTYNEKGHLVKRTTYEDTVEQRIEQFTFDDNGNLLTQTAKEMETGTVMAVENTYKDGLLEVRTETQDGQQIRKTIYLYNEAKQVTTATIHIGGEVQIQTHSYSSEQETITVTDDGGQVLHSTVIILDGEGRKQTETLTTGDGATSTTTYIWQPMEIQVVSGAAS